MKIKALNCLEQLHISQHLADTHCHIDRYANDLAEVEKLAIKSLDAGVKEWWLMSVTDTSFINNITVINYLTKKTPQLITRLALGFDMELLIPGSELFNPSLFELSDLKVAAFVDWEYSRLTNLAKRSNLEVNLIGEIGLDYYRLKDLDAELIKHSQELQLILFSKQVEYAAKNNLPISIHSRSAEKESLKIISKFKKRYPKLQAIFHSFTESKLVHKVIVEKNYLGINGICSYKTAEALLLAIKKELPVNPKLADIYANNFLLETDSPFLIPSNVSRKSLTTENSNALNDPSSIKSILTYLEN